MCTYKSLMKVVVDCTESGSEDPSCESHVTIDGYSSSPDFHHPVDGLLVQLIIQNLTHILVLN